MNYSFHKGQVRRYNRKFGHRIYECPMYIHFDKKQLLMGKIRAPTKELADLLAKSYFAYLKMFFLKKEHQDALKRALHRL